MTGTTDELRHDSRAGRFGDHWHQARAFVADEILDHVARRRIPLETLQRDVLVPLELDGIACRTTSLRTPGGPAPRQRPPIAKARVSLAEPHRTRGREKANGLARS